MRRLLVVCLVLTAWMGVLTSVALGAGRLTRVGGLPRLPAGTTVAGAVSPGRELHVTVTLAPRSASVLAQDAQAVSDPASSRFHRYLTEAQFVRRFAPTQASVDAVLSSLRRHGLSPGTVSPNRLAIPIAGSAGAIERAFGVALEEVRLPGGRLATVSASRPAVDASVGRLVQSVIGLSSLNAPSPLSVGPRNGGTRSVRAAGAERGNLATGGPRACGAARSQAKLQGVHTSDQIASAYQFSTLFRRGDEGRGVRVAVYELEPDAASDIAAYQKCYGTHTAIGYVKVDGGVGSGAGYGESALDIEQLIGLAPRARLLVYQGPNSQSAAPGSGPYDVYNAIVSQDRASVISTSWGECEPTAAQSAAVAENTLFEEAALQGQTVVAASGDVGSEGCFAPPFPTNSGLAVQDPSSQPFVTGVGGTTLSALGPPPSETTWNNRNTPAVIPQLQEGASGGGISSFWSMPAYQRRAPASLKVVGADSSGSPCGSRGDCREVPDVSADGDPNTGYLIYYSGSWQSFGGTSAAAPVWAGLVALADANRACARVRLGFVNPTLYRLAGANQHAYFNDVRSGNNDYTGTNGRRYPAGLGYDMATGLGTPKGGALARALCRQGLRLGTPRTQHSILRRWATLRLRASDARHAGLRLAVTGLPPGLRLRPRRRISGRPIQSGTFTVTVRATDSDGALRAVRFLWKVRAR